MRCPAPGARLTHTTSAAGPYGIMIAIGLVTSAVGSIVSNNAVVVLMFPVVYKAFLRANADPTDPTLPFIRLLAVMMVAASCSFASPIRCVAAGVFGLIAARARESVCASRLYSYAAPVLAFPQLSNQPHGAERGPLPLRRVLSLRHSAAAHAVGDAAHHFDTDDELAGA